MTSPARDPAAPAIEVRDLHKYFGDNEVLKGIDFEVDNGQVVCVIGPSGSGKSTLLRCVNRLEEPTSGKIFVEGIDITDPETDLNGVRSRIGMVFQSFNLFPHLTVMRNLTLAQQRVRKRGKAEAVEIARANLDKVGLEGKENAYPAHLSGGQQQRVAIARALVTEPSLILADEPTGALDTRTSEEIMGIFETLNRELGLTVVIVTHEAEVAHHTRRVVHVRDGLIEEGAAPRALGALDRPAPTGLSA